MISILRYFTSLIFICLFATNAMAQEEDFPFILDDEEQESDPLNSRFVLEAGITKMRPWKLNEQLFGSHQFDQLMTFGFTAGYCDETEPDTEDPDALTIGGDLSYGFHVFWPVTIQRAASNGDPVKYRLGGWEIMTSTFAVNLVSNEHIDFVSGIGVFWGNLRLHSKNDTENAKRQLYKNPFIAPMVRAELRFNFASFSAGGRFSYRYDITNEKWKRRDDGLEPLPGYKFREIQYLFFIGWTFIS